jgi:uncharacterized protein YqfA (UPF0365 family)
MKLLLFAVPIVAVVAFLVVFGMFFRLWVEAKAVGLPVTIFGMMMMRLRGIQPAPVVELMKSLWKAGIEVPLGDMETHILAGGDLHAVAEAAIASEKADLGMNFRSIAAIDLAGRDVVDAVKTHVNPKVLLCPPPGQGQSGISGVAQDGIRLAARARVTVRTQLGRLVGGAGEQTIIARVGEGIVAAIGSAESHREILEHPERISEYLLERGLDSGTCFEILSVDIADVDVLDNVAARLQSQQAAADTRIAQANAEMRRAAAIASRQEMKARTVEMEGRVTAAKSTVPLAVSSAFVEANMGSQKPLVKTHNYRLRWKPLGTNL